MFKVASWNVNSLPVRLDQVLAWLEASNTDVLAVQETKVSDDKFPLEAFTSRGYQVCFSGQKTYNGVAIISRQPVQEVLMEVPGFFDPQRRVLAATVAGVRMINLYVPNGAAVGSDKYAYKLAWLTQIKAFVQQQLADYPRLIVLGDFNIAPHDDDVHDPALWAGSVLVSAEERQAFQQLLSIGLVDSFRLLTQPERAFSWWDYRAGGFRRNHGLRIDLILLSQMLAQQVETVGIDVQPRRAERPSDHTPVWVALSASALVG